MSQNNQAEEHKEFQEEYEDIRKDTKTVLITNSIFLILIIALYYINEQAGILDRFLESTF